MYFEYSGVLFDGSPNRVRKRQHYENTDEFTKRKKLALGLRNCFPKIFSVRCVGKHQEWTIEYMHGCEKDLCAHRQTELLARMLCFQASQFVHGDLKPSNILVRDRIYFIDWISNLKSFEGTPRYADAEAFKGRHNLNTDLHAITQILAENNKMIYSV